MSLGDRIFESIDLTFSIKPNSVELVSIGEAEERDAKQIYLCQTNVEWHPKPITLDLASTLPGALLQMTTPNAIIASSRSLLRHPRKDQQQLQTNEVEAEVKEIIAQAGAVSIKDMGKVMGGSRLL